MKHATAPGQNTDFRKSEKSSISTGCAKNESSVTSGINFSVALFTRHSVYLHNNDIINAVHGGGDGPPSFCLLFLCPANPVCQDLIRTAQRFQVLLHGALANVDFHPFSEHRLLCRFTQR
ncbi:hypothetical protein G3S63_002840, partial [Escherichia coli]|nr:hypothetical protein [Escherichia coli]